MRFRRRPRPRPRPKPRPRPQPPAPPAPQPAPKPIQRATTPEGTYIEINSAGRWTTEQIYGYLKAAGLDARIGPSLKVFVQDQYGSQVTTSAGTGADGRYDNFHAFMYLQGVNSTLGTQPHALVAHEYGHVWSLYHLYISQQNKWDAYLNFRGLSGNPKVDTGDYVWSKREIIADDYRLLFGPEAAAVENPSHMNSEIPDPRNVLRLKDFLLNEWAKSTP